MLFFVWSPPKSILSLSIVVLWSYIFMELWSSYKQFFNNSSGVTSQSHQHFILYHKVQFQNCRARKTFEFIKRPHHLPGIHTSRFLQRFFFKLKCTYMYCRRTVPVWSCFQIFWQLLAEVQCSGRKFDFRIPIKQDKTKLDKTHKTLNTQTRTYQYFTYHGCNENERPLVSTPSCSMYVLTRMVLNCCRFGRLCLRICELDEWCLFFDSILNLPAKKFQFFIIFLVFMLLHSIISLA